MKGWACGAELHVERAIFLEGCCCAVFWGLVDNRSGCSTLCKRQQRLKALNLYLLRGDWWCSSSSAAWPPGIKSTGISVTATVYALRGQCCCSLSSSVLRCCTRRDSSTWHSPQHGDTGCSCCPCTAWSVLLSLVIRCVAVLYVSRQQHLAQATAREYRGFFLCVPSSVLLLPIIRCGAALCVWRRCVCVCGGAVCVAALCVWWRCVCGGAVLWRQQHLPQAAARG